jgi:riboflavin synthase
MIHKGSVAVAGVSLTIAALRPGAFEVSLIPHTLRATTLEAAQAGDPVNIECDMIGRWVRRILAPGQGAGGLTIEQLRSQGF